VKITSDNKALLFFVKKQNGPACLLLSIDPQNCRAELLTLKEANAIETISSSIFPQLDQAILEKIEQFDFDRMINFYFVRKSQFEKTKKYRLVAELTGRNSNLILVDEEDEKIVSYLSGVRTSPSKFRQIRTGGKYIPLPPPKKINPLTIKPAQFRELLLQNNQTILLEFLIDRFSSIDVFLAKNIAQLAGMDVQKKIVDLTLPEIENLLEGFDSFFKDVVQLKFRPQIIFDELKMPKAISIFSLPFIPQDQKRDCPSVNQAIKIFFQIKQRETNRAELYKIITRQIAKLETRLGKLHQDLGEAKRYEDFRKFGDLLIANIQCLKRGMGKIKLIDLFDQKQKEVTIPLEPSLGPIKNAKKYFEKFKKGKTAVKVIRKRLDQTVQEKAKLTALLSQLRKKLSLEELYEIRTNLMKAGYIPKTKNETKKGNEKLSAREFMTSDGFRILVGKNDRENDYLSFKLAKKDDLWFHADGSPGSHVILLKDQRKAEFSKDAVNQAGSLAAYFSKARNSKKVAVIYTLAKYLKKPKGAKAGLVTVTKEKSIVVVPKLLK
jgi:predicted ribosome quality control (RQC) complex YloA/Tae2 family protein